MKRKIAKITSVILLILFVVSCASTVNTNIASGRVIEVSKYGNITTDILKSEFDEKGFELGDILTIVLNNQALEAPYGSGYPNVDTGKLIILSSDGVNISVAINMGNFAKTYSASNGTEISFFMKEKGGYLDELELRSVESKRTNNRKDYKSDEVFANFREVKVGNIKANRLYRSSNPVNPELGRNEYVDALIKKVGVKTAMNLADSQEELESYPSYKTSYYATIDVIPLNMGVDFISDDFNAKLKKGLTFLSTHETPFLVHCTEGKDRAGFVNALIECLSGASFDEVVADYMTTYENYYFIEKGSKQYESIAKSNIYKMLENITGESNINKIKTLNLLESAKKYLKNSVGLSDSVIDTLYNKLCL